MFRISVSTYARNHVYIFFQGISKYNLFISYYNPLKSVVDLLKFMINMHNKKSKFGVYVHNYNYVKEVFRVKIIIDTHKWMSSIQYLACYIDHHKYHLV